MCTNEFSAFLEGFSTTLDKGLRPSVLLPKRRSLQIFSEAVLQTHVCKTFQTTVSFLKMYYVSFDIFALAFTNETVNIKVVALLPCLPSSVCTSVYIAGL